MSAHTPGPWEVVYDDAGKPVSIRSVGSVSKGILKWGSFPMPSYSDTKANARLLASAPDLLDAAEQALELLEADLWQGGVLEVLRAAIAKATGESK